MIFSSSTNSVDVVAALNKINFVGTGAEELIAHGIALCFLWGYIF